MKISTHPKHVSISTMIVAFAVAVFLSGCPSAEQKPAKQPSTPEKKETVAKPIVPPQEKTEPEPSEPSPKQINTTALEKSLSEEMTEMSTKPRKLGDPLVDNLDQLVRLDPVQPVWIDPNNKHIVLLGEVCRAGYPLEFFATYSNRSYESVVSINVMPSIVHAGLLRLGAQAGSPAKFEPEFVSPTGTEVAIDVRWKDAAGQVQSAPAQQWIRNIKTRKPLDCNWVFAGSMFITDEESGSQSYAADSGELICVLNLPTAMLDLPIRSYGAIEARTFEAFEENLPPEGTPVTILLKPILDGDAAKAPEKPDPKQIEAEQKAVEAIEPWLKLVDEEQYLRSWESAAEYLKNTVERRDFVKALNASRKPFGALVSRELGSKKYATTAPGAPDGQYVILQYKTTFANKKSAVETVTAMQDADEKWRVSGYYVK